VPAFLWHVLRDALLMAWEVWWALVLGFAISAVVQTWVPRARIERSLAGSGPRALALATGLGAASSSCSYAAVAIARSLFQKGASAATALAFQFSSTNLVWELGLVLWVLIGWQFALAEYLGGILMVALMALLTRAFVSASLERQAREHALRAGATADDHCHHHGAEPHRHPAAEDAEGNGSTATGPTADGPTKDRPTADGPTKDRPTADGPTKDEPTATGAPTLRARLSSRAEWSRVAGNFRADWRMLYREIATGFLLAGVIAQLGNGFFESLFVRSAPAPLPALENALVGPLIAVASFVCSVGNVPLAAVLWSGGIGFAGVVSFLFADLIVLPIIAIYRKYYGGEFALRIVALMFVTMVLASLAISAAFGLLGLIPIGPRPSRAGVFGSVKVDYKLFLNLLGAAVFAALFTLGTGARRRLAWRSAP
jgi:uncharacterized membrane protein YraQ (UPF0718 family)